MKRNHLYIFFFLTLFLYSCENEISSPVPNWPVSFSLELAPGHPHDDILNPMGYYLKTTAKGGEKIGFAGVLVYQSSIGEYFAFDLACPVEPVTVSKKISSPNDRGVCKCTHCGSEFSLESFGTPKSGSALEQKRSLKRYSSQIQGRRLVVSN